ncbi:hypothetical protein [Streptomyces sp. KR80]|uniref:hypothetical protein n=1 Tax=Streptomyces sp. KR80 TaxID=3457426 RepID=UPI003FD17C58
MAQEAATAELVPAGERGATRIADRVVAKIASQAAREVLREAPQAQQVPAGGRPHATVSVVRRGSAPGEAGALHGEARVRVAVELGYPSDIGAQCGAVRRAVTERVRALAGMDVPEVAVTVERLHSAYSQAVGQGRVR